MQDDNPFIDWDADKRLLGSLFPNRGSSSPILQLQQNVLAVEWSFYSPRELGETYYADVQVRSTDTLVLYDKINLLANAAFKEETLYRDKRAIQFSIYTTDSRENLDQHYKKVSPAFDEVAVFLYKHNGSEEITIKVKMDERLRQYSMFKGKSEMETYQVSASVGSLENVGLSGETITEILSKDKKFFDEKIFGKGKKKEQDKDKPKDEKKKDWDNDITVTVYCTDPNHANKAIIENEIVYISAEPQMPQITISISQAFHPPKTGVKYATLLATVEVTHVVNDGQKQRNDSFRIPKNPNYFLRFDYKLKTTFKMGGIEIKENVTEAKNVVPWYDSFRGGKAVVRVYADKVQVQEFTFHIRGLNPTKKKVYEYLDEKGYANQFWFIKSLLMHESGSKGLKVMQQFNDKEYDKSWDFGSSGKGKEIAGTPIWGYKDGWGMGQIDLSGSKDEKGTPKTAETEALWNWKKNVDLAIQILGEKVQAMKDTSQDKATKQFYGFLGKVKEFQKQNPSVDVSKHSTEDIKEGEITFINCQSEIPDLATLNDYMDGERNKERKGGDTGLVKSFLDADLIKHYNYGRFLDSLKLDGDGKVYWEIKDLNPDGVNYVQEVCLIKSNE